LKPRPAPLRLPRACAPAGANIDSLAVGLNVDKALFTIVLTGTPQTVVGWRGARMEPHARAGHLTSTQREARRPLGRAFKAGAGRRLREQARAQAPLRPLPAPRAAFDRQSNLVKQLSKLVKVRYVEDITRSTRVGEPAGALTARFDRAP
jgi:hypothetical protein